MVSQPTRSIPGGIGPDRGGELRASLDHLLTLRLRVPDRRALERMEVVRSTESED
jgi:hypothetical protein